MEYASRGPITARLSSIKSIILRIIVDAYRYYRNDDCTQRDSGVKFVREVIRDFSKRHEQRLHRKFNVEVK